MCSGIRRRGRRRDGMRRALARNGLLPSLPAQLAASSIWDPAGGPRTGIFHLPLVRTRSGLTMLATSTMWGPGFTRQGHVGGDHLDRLVASKVGGMSLSRSFDGTDFSEPGPGSRVVRATDHELRGGRSHAVRGRAGLPLGTGRARPRSSVMHLPGALNSSWVTAPAGSTPPCTTVRDWPRHSRGSA